MTITIANDSFANELFLKNLLKVSTTNSSSTQAIAIQPSLFRIGAPNLVITKGISASNNPTADATISPSASILPVDGDISSSDAGDTITYVITVENTGDAPAHDVTITDPAISALKSGTIVSVQDGSGILSLTARPLTPTL